LGSPRWLGADPSFDIVFTRDGEQLFAAKTEDSLFADASRTVRELSELGLTSYLATGDAQERALRVAHTCAIPESRVFFEATPERKAAIVKSLEDKSLFVGDGLNDALAATAAYAAGTPVAGTTFLAARTDFYLLRPGVNTIAKLFRSARALAKAQDRSLTWAVSYNVIALVIAFSGAMNPLSAAILMPLSTLISVSIVMAAIGPKGTLWTHSTSASSSACA
jgi:Cu2+-exporting ATPase